MLGASCQQERVLTWSAAKTKSLNQMMGSTCEAFALIDYTNNYVTWRNECKQEMCEEMSDVSARSAGSAGSAGSIRPYTGNATGAQGKYNRRRQDRCRSQRGGWS